MNTVKSVFRLVGAAVLLLVATDLAAAGPSGDRYTLTCTGLRDDGGGAKPFSTEFRVDLKAGRWCDDKCDDVRPFAKVERDRLTFSESETGTFTEWSYVDRRTGEYTQVFRSDLLRSSSKGQCARGAYKPITFKKRKF